MSLTDAAIRKAIRGTREGERRKLADGAGLYLLIAPPAQPGWRHKYRFGGREKLLSHGVYPLVDLKRAREKHLEARRQLEHGEDPADTRKAARAATSDTFCAIAEEWLTKRKNLAPVTISKARWLIGFLAPSIGSRPVREITAPMLLAALRKIEATGHHETAARAKMRAGQIFRYAIATGRCDRDISADLRGALESVETRNHAALTDPAQVGALLRAIDAYQGQPATVAALKLAPLVFVRPGELRAAEWCEFDTDKAEWRIPAARMKMGEQHLVPLSSQAVTILRELRPLTGDGRFLFPSLRTPARPMSNNAITAALRRMGYSGDEQTGHGFRSMASTLLNEQGWHPDLIELQLAHAERNKVRAAYNKAQRLTERRKMMQAWADYLDTLRAEQATR